jgi:hypothetical protein
MAGLVLAFALFAIMGIGIGALLRNQMLATSLGLVFLLVINNLIAAIPRVRAAYPYTPAGAMIAIVYPPGSNSAPVATTPSYRERLTETAASQALIRAAPPRRPQTMRPPTPTWTRGKNPDRAFR